MKRTSLLSIVGAVLGLLGTSAAFGQMSGNNILYTPTVDLSAMSQNTYVGNVGGVFLSTYNDWPYVNWLGYADPTGQGLVNSHAVSLWYAGGQNGSTSYQVALATVPAGTAAPLVDGYRWVQIPTVGLWYGSWYTISAQTDGVDLWGDLISGSQGTWDAQYVGGEADWTRAGRYDTPASWPNSPLNQVSTTDSIYPVANLAYNLTVVPEPASWSLLGLGLAVGLALRRKEQD